MKKLLLSIAVFSAVQLSINAQTTTLFDGKTLTGWHTYLKTGTGAWKIVDHTLELDPNAKGQGDLVTDKEYENFDLSLMWKISEGGNSGIIIGINEDPKFDNTYLTGIEMQILDDRKAEDNKKATHLAGALYDMIAPKSPAFPAGQWNLVKIRKLKGRLTFWLNGVKDIDIQIGSPQWNILVDKSKFKTWKGFAAFKKGHIALQDHGAVVSFKDIKITEL